MFKHSIRRLVEEKRFVEALYFGSVELASNPTAELHLDLGLACCAAIKPIAEVERNLALEQAGNEPQANWNTEGLIVGRDTGLVNEGLHHLLQATHLNPQIRFPTSLEPITIEVIQDLHDYLRQEFHGFRSFKLGYSLGTAALAAVVLLYRLQAQAQEKIEFLSATRLKVADELLAKLSSS